MQQSDIEFFKIEDHFIAIEVVPTVAVFEHRLTPAPRFTIAIPTCNRIDTLHEAIESAVNQDINEPYEIVVADNNPERDDATEQLMKQYAGLPNLSYYKNTRNIGMAGNWNRLVDLTRGEYIVLLHDDDCIAPFFLTTAVKILAEHSDASLLQFTKINEKRFEYNEAEVCARRLKIVDNIEHNTVSAPTGTIYRKDTVKALGGWNPEFYPSHDYCFDNLLMAKGYKVFKSPLKATFYRIGINVSLKKDTKVGLVKIDTGLRRRLLRHIGFPSFLSRRYLELYNENLMHSWSLTPEDIAPMAVGRYSFTSKRIAAVLACRYIHFMRHISQLLN